MGSTTFWGANSMTLLTSTPWVGKTPWRREWPPTPVFLPGEPHGQRRLVGYSPWGCKESDTTEQLTLSLSNTQRVSQGAQW